MKLKVVRLLSKIFQLSYRKTVQKPHVHMLKRLLNFNLSENLTHRSFYYKIGVCVYSRPSLVYQNEIFSAEVVYKSGGRMIDHNTDEVYVESSYE